MITSLQNERVKLVRGLQSQRKIRLMQGRFVVEGPRLVEEAVRSGSAVDFVLYTAGVDGRSQAVLHRLRQDGVAAIEVSPAVMLACADTEHPQPVLAVVPLPARSSPSFAGRGAGRGEQPLVLICDRIADPGNLGTLLRAAAAAGVNAAFLGPGTVDAFNPKVVRGGMGAHFRLPIETLEWEDLVKRVAGLRVFLAEACAGKRHDQVDWTGPSAVIVGGEAEGAGDGARAAAAEPISIPMPGGAESLNAAVAGSIILFEAVRQRLAAHAGQR